MTLNSFIAVFCNMSNKFRNNWVTRSSQEPIVNDNDMSESVQEAISDTGGDSVSVHQQH